jgi:predicted RNA-binding Zn-ribbon protein involved in translation (DUF1610 family)
MDVFLVNLTCSSTRHPGVGRFVWTGESWVLQAASRQRPHTAIPASDARQARTGTFGVADGYRGCPSCGSTSYVRCGRCEQLACYDYSWPQFSCPTCGITGSVTQGIDSISSLAGG